MKKIKKGIGLEDLKGPFQLKRSYDSMTSQEVLYLLHCLQHTDGSYNMVS